MPRITTGRRRVQSHPSRNRSDMANVLVQPRNHANETYEAYAAAARLIQWIMHEKHLMVQVNIPELAMQYVKEQQK